MREQSISEYAPKKTHQPTLGQKSQQMRSPPSQHTAHQSSFGSLGSFFHGTDVPGAMPGTHTHKLITVTRGTIKGKNGISMADIEKKSKNMINDRERVQLSS